MNLSYRNLNKVYQRVIRLGRKFRQPLPTVRAGPDRQDSDMTQPFLRKGCAKQDSARGVSRVPIWKIKSNGLTLLEIIISIGIFVLVATAVSLVFNRSIFVYGVSTNKQQASQQAAIAMEWLMRDISGATCIYGANSGSIVLRNPNWDRNPTCPPCDPPCDPTCGYVKYYLQNPTTLVRNNCTADSLLAENLVSLNLTYYDWHNQPTTFASAAKEAEITLTTSSGGQKFTLYTVASPMSCVGGCLLAKTYGGNGTDDLYSLQQTSDGGYILGGYTTSFGSGGDFLVIKTDGAGNVNVGDTGTWAKSYNVGAPDQLNSLQQTSDGGYILGGYTSSNGDDFLVIKTTSSGSLDTTNFGTGAESFNVVGTSSDRLNSLQQTSDGGYILGGYTSSNGDDFLVIKTTSSGSLDTINFGTGAESFNVVGTSSDQLNSLQQTSDGYILGGNTSSNGGDFLVIKIGSTGAFSWAESFNVVGTSSDRLNSLQQTSDGGYILGGNTSSNGGDFLVIKTTSNGSLDTTNFGTGAKSYNVGAPDQLNSLLQTSDGGYILGGNTTSAGNSELLVIKTDKSGNTTGGDCGTGTPPVQCWTKAYGGTGLEGLHFLRQALDADRNPNGYLLGGYTESFGPGGSGRNFLVIRIDASGNIICCIPGFTVTTLTNITPNPLTLTPNPLTLTPNPVTADSNSVCPPP